MKFFASLFKRDELQRRGITIDEEVGHGTYSKVYKGRLRRSEEVSSGIGERELSQFSRNKFQLRLKLSISRRPQLILSNGSFLAK